MKTGNTAFKSHLTPSYTPKIVHCRFDDINAISDRVIVRNRLATLGLDHINHLVGGASRLTVAVTRHPEVVHDDAGATRGELERVLLAEAGSGTSDNGD